METEYLILLCIAVNMVALYVIVGAKNTTTKVGATPKKTAHKVETKTKKEMNQRGARVSNHKREAMIEALDECVLKNSISQGELMKLAKLSASSVAKWRNKTSSPSICTYSKIMKTIKELENNAASK